MAFSTASFVDFGRAHQDDRIVKRCRASLDEALCAAGVLPADHADCVELADIFGASQQLRHWAERQAAEILIKARANNSLAAVGQSFADHDDVAIEKLHFVDGHDVGLNIDGYQYILRLADTLGLKMQPILGCNLFNVVAGVNGRLESLNLLASDDGATQAADHLFRLAAKHAAADDFDSSSWVRPIGLHSCDRLLELKKADTLLNVSALLSSDRFSIQNRMAVCA